MNRFCYILFFILIRVSMSFAQTESHEKLKWYTNMMEAHAISEATDKPLFAFFTGSDWCGWCKKLQKDVFSKAEFIEWAQKNVVLVELDFPRNKELPAEIVKQNNELQQVFRVGGFPTIWMFYMTKDASTNNFNISALGSLGYPSGATAGKEEVTFLSNANNILAKKTK
jgi:thioredoxin-related protein